MRYRHDGRARSDISFTHHHTHTNDHLVRTHDLHMTRTPLTEIYLC